MFFYVLTIFVIYIMVIKYWPVNITLNHKKKKLIVEWHGSWIYFFFFMCVIKLIISINDTCVRGQIKK